MASAKSDAPITASTKWIAPSLVGDDLNHWNNFLVQAERGAVMLNCAAWHNYS